MARFVDLSSSLLPHPDTGQLMVKTDERAITQSIRSLVLTDRGERPMEPDVGGNVRSLLFDLFDAQTEDLARDYILEVLKQEKRASINNVIVKADEQNSRLFILIEYVYSGAEAPVKVNITLSRVR